MSDDFVRQFPAGVVPMHQPKSLEENLKADAVEFEARKRADPKLVPDVYDMFHDAQAVQHQAAPTDIPDAHERERIVREEREFLQAFERGLTEVLPQAGFRLVRCINDGHGNGWRAQVKDTEGRPFAVEISYDDAIKAGSQHGANMGQHLMAMVMARLAEARERYFLRMGVELS